MDALAGQRVGAPLLTHRARIVRKLRDMLAYLVLERHLAAPDQDPDAGRGLG
jgi:hypothetical protein